MGCPPFRPFIIGVDISVWFEQCQQVTRGRGHPQSGQNPALRTFFFRTARLSSFPIQLIFAYDGSDRPALKRGTSVITAKDHWMVRPTQRILNAFNIQWFTAKGEAEAELAAMCSMGTVDAVMTDDSDVFAFGCHRVIRNSSFRKSTVDVYDANMSREDYALVALLCGGDYDMRGLPGCGPATAFGLVRCGLGHSLRGAECGCGFSDPHREAWRNDLQRHLRYDPMSSIGRRHPTLAERIPDEVPNFDIWSAYLHPAINEPLVAVREPGIPDVGKIAAVAVSLLGWEDATRLLNTFRERVWPSVITSELLQDLSAWKPNNQHVVSAGAAARYLFSHPAPKQRTIDKISGYNVQVPADALAEKTFEHLDLPVPKELSKPCRFWVPEAIYSTWTQFMSLINGGEFSDATSPKKTCVATVAGSSSEDVIDLTNVDSTEWVIDLTTDDSCSSSISKGKSKAWPMDVIDLT